MLLYNKIIIYYLSGTGNALKAVNWIKEFSHLKNADVVAHSIDRFNTIVKPVTDNKTLIGFCYPTHGFSLPWIMLKFILKFPVMRKQKFFLLNTRAGSKFFKLYFPGISGIAQILPMLILFLKGLGLKGLMPLDMPSNWISIHPGFTKKCVSEITERRKKDTERFTDKILTAGHFYSYKVFVYLWLDLAVSWISVLYMLIGRFALSKAFMASKKCSDCRLCEELCPVGAIKIKDNLPYWSTKCESCMRCMNICPVKSIQTPHLFYISITYILLSLPLSYWLASAGLLNITTDNSFLKLIAFFTEQYLYLLFLFISYNLFFFVIKWTPINKFFEYTSLTRYWYRYRAEGISAKDFHIK